MALRARDGNVTARQNEMCFFVLRQCEGRRLVALEIVAAVAGVEVRCGHKLPGVPIAVAIGAFVELHSIERVLALGNVALRTFQAKVAALQRVFRRSVFLDSEERWFPALHLVAGRALASIGTLQELAVVGVFVAIRALVERDRLLEIAIGMTPRAFDLRVLAFEGIFGFGVIEAFFEILQGDPLPPGSGVAGCAGLRETAVVRIFVTIRALVERNAGILRLAIGTVGMALGALDLRVQARQWIAGLTVIELSDIDLLPVNEVVTGLAGRSKATLVKILVTGHAGGG